MLFRVLGEDRPMLLLVDELRVAKDDKEVMTQLGRALNGFGNVDEFGVCAVAKVHRRSSEAEKKPTANNIHPAFCCRPCWMQTCARRNVRHGQTVS